MKLNKLQQAAFDLIVNSRQNVLLTGNAGTGKSFTINAVVKALKEKGRNVQVCASTALAATAISGKTMHSALAIYPVWGKPNARKTLSEVIDLTLVSPASKAAKKIRRYDVIIVDEVSMIHIMDLIRLDAQLKNVHQNDNPFGGVQMVFVGDFLQLEPVHNAETCAVPLPHGQSAFCFESVRAWQPANIQVIQLEEIVRQQDVVFATFLNNIRCGIWHPWMQKIVEERTVTEAPEGVPFFLPTNQEVDAINEREMAKLPGDPVVNMAWDYNPNRFVNGKWVENTDHWDKNCLALKELTLKVGARVICLVNSPIDALSPDGEKLRLINGDMGTVTGFHEQYPIVLWDRFGYEMTPGEHTFSQGDEFYRKQIPVKPCWALTVHKSQGMTLDSACVDLTRAFATGQVYVALSRVRTLDGLYIRSFDAGKIKAHPKALEFYGITGNYVGDDENGPDGGNDIGVPPNTPNPSNSGPEAIVSEPQTTTEVENIPPQEKEEEMKKAPACIRKHEKLSPETQDWLREILERDVAPFLETDISSYAPGRQRVWMPYEAPLDNKSSMDKPFMPKLMHEELWQWIVDLCDKWGMKAQTALISKGGNIYPHRDTTYADEWAFAINLGACEWGIASDRQSPDVDYVMGLKGGEVFSFNCKHVHQVQNAAPDRWAINVWAIASKTRKSQEARIAERLEEMLGKNPDLDDFIRRHQPGAQAIANVPQITNQEINPTNNQTEESSSMIYHWLEQSDVVNAKGWLVRSEADSELVMTITNNPELSRKTAYDKALANNGSAIYNDQHKLWLMPVPTSSWKFHYLERLSARGIKFTLQIRRLKLMEEPWDKAFSLGGYLSKQANLCWVDNSSMYFMRIHGVDPSPVFDWSLIGLEVNDSKKMVKRLQELTRMTEWATSGRMRTQAIAPEKKSQNPELWVKAMDGKNVIKMSSLPEATQQRLLRTGIRHLMGRGWTWVQMEDVWTKVLVKGDFVVIDDLEWTHGDYDVVAHVENCKSEVVLCTSGQWVGHEDLWTFWAHDPLHQVNYDQQSMGNYPEIFSLREMQRHYKKEMSGIDESLKKGLLPGMVEEETQVQASDEAHDEWTRFMPKPNEIRKQRGLAKVITDVGLDIRMFENLIYLAVNGYAESKAKFIDNNVGSQLYGNHTKHVVTIPNAFSATCVTDTFLRHFADIPYTANRCARFDERYGMVWNGLHFARAFELHGTHDKDDTHQFVAMRVWGDQHTVQMLKDAGVILQDVEIPSTEEEAKLMLFVYRLPNGAGEYSFIEFDFSTWPCEIPLDMLEVRTFELNFHKGWPKPQPMVMPRNVPGLPTSRIYSKKAYTRADLATDFKAQVVNPGFGAMCNALLTYSIITEGNIPRCMTDSLGNIVDATQQGADIESFKAIQTLMGEIANEISTIPHAAMDTYLFLRRGAIAKKAVANGDLRVYEGKFLEFDQLYKDTYQQLSNSIRFKYSFYMRRDVAINKKVLSVLQFTPEQIDWAKNFLKELLDNIRETDKDTSDLELTKFTKPLIQASARERRHKIVDAAIEQIESTDDPRQTALLLWYTILKPKAMGEEATHGAPDRAICQMGSERSIAHLVIDAIVHSKELCIKHNPVNDDDRYRCDHCGRR